MNEAPGAAHSNALTPPAEPRRFPRRAATGVAVLVVEDEPDLRTIIAYVLRLGGYEVITAGDGAEALQRLHTGRLPSVIVLDLMMPGMDGLQFRRVQLADPRIATVPVIVCTGYPDAPSRGALAASAWIDKPFDFDALLDLVDTHRLKN